MQLKGMNLCDFCFEPINTENICPKCGLSHNNYHAEAGLLMPGTNLLGKYIIGRVLGRGGFGATYLAYSSELNRTVAIKEYLPINIVYRGKDEENVTVVSEDKRDVFKKGAERFFEEAKTISKFNKNNNIVSVYEFFYTNNTVYYSMELLDGMDLKKYVVQNGGNLSLNEVIHILKCLCNALMVVHSTQIFHRDISPDNIFMCSNGEIKLIDFGNAKQVISNQSQSYSVVVKHGFAPAEQYTRKGKQGVWTDIYAVGATAYFALTGKIPPDAIERTENPNIIIVNNNDYKDINRIINKCMQIKPSARYQSAIELLDDLNKIRLKPPKLVPKTEWHTTEETKEHKKQREDVVNKKETRQILKQKNNIKKNVEKKSFQKPKQKIKIAHIQPERALDKKVFLAIASTGFAVCIALTVCIIKVKTSNDVLWEDINKEQIENSYADSDTHTTENNVEEGILDNSICPECGSAEHTVHPKEEAVRCPECGSAEHTVHSKKEAAKCPECGSTAHTVHPKKEAAKCPECGSTAHTVHPKKEAVKCPECGSTAHTVHPKEEAAKCPECGSTAHTVHPKKEVAKCPECGSIEHTVHPQKEASRCPECGSTEHTTHPKKEKITEIEAAIRNNKPNVISDFDY